MNALSLSFSRRSQGFLCSPSAHNEHNFTPQRPIRDMTATCRHALPVRRRDLRVDHEFQNECLSSLIWFSSSSGIWIVLPWALFIPSETKLLTTNWDYEAWGSEIKTTTWQKQVRLSFPLHSASKWADLVNCNTSLCWFSDYSFITTVAHAYKGEKWSHHTPISLILCCDLLTCIRNVISLGWASVRHASRGTCVSR